MKKVNIWGFVLLGSAHFLICIFSGALGWDIQMVVVSAISSITLYFLNRKKNLDLIKSFALIAPFFLFYTILSLFFTDNPLNYPVWIGGFFAAFLSIFTFTKKVYSFLVFNCSNGVVVISVLSFLSKLFCLPNKRKES